MLVVGGDVLVDLIQFAQTSSQVSFNGMRGGSSYNTAIAAARQGAKTTFLTPLSNDSLGTFLVDELVKSGVGMAADRKNAPTGLAVVTLLNEQPSYQFYREGTADRDITLEDMKATCPADTRVFHISSLALASGPDADDWAQFFNEMDPSVIRCLDPNIRPLLIPDRDSYMKRLHSMLATVDVLKLSDEDLEWIYPDHSLDQAIAKLKTETTAKWLFVTKGGDGAEVFWGDNHLSAPAAQVTKLIDTVGAGDTFMGSLLSALCDDPDATPEGLPTISPKDMAMVLDRAARAAALNCEQSGCNPPWRDALGL